MARFSQGILQGLMQPAFGQNLYEVGRAAAAGPAMTKASQRMKEERERTQRGVTGGLFGLEQAVAEDRDYQDALGSLVALGATPEQITAAQERGRATKKRTEEEARLSREQEAVKRLTSAAFIKAAKSEDPVSSEAFVRSLVDTQDFEGLRKFLGPTAKGTKAKANVVTEEVLEKGKIVTYSVSLDPYDGKELGRVKIGEKPAEEDDKKTLAEERAEFFYTSEGSKLYSSVVAEGNTASADVTKFSNLLNEAERVAAEEPWYNVGGILGDVRDFAVSDIAGLGDEITSFRTSLNEVQMQQAIALLPRGPASDRDVQLALNASPDLKDYSPQERIAALRGMLKIKQAHQEYIEGKTRWIEQTRDPTALGYERYAAVKGLDKKIQAVKDDFGPVIQQLDFYLGEAAKLREAGDTVAADAMIAFVQEEQARLQNQSRQNAQADPTMAVFDIDYLDLLTRRGLENSRYLKFLDENEIKFQ